MVDRVKWKLLLVLGLKIQRGGGGWLLVLVASSIALVAQLTAMLEAWRVVFIGSNQPWVFHTDLPAQIFSFFSFFQNEKKVKKRSSEVSPLIFRNKKSNITSYKIKKELRPWQ